MSGNRILVVDVGADCLKLTKTLLENVVKWLKPSTEKKLFVRLKLAPSNC